MKNIGAPNFSSLGNFGDAPNIFSLYKTINMLPSRMPRKARVDAPGALHHIICRGIEGGTIFQNAADRMMQL